MKRRFDEDGFVALPGFLSPDEIAELRGEIDRYIAEVAPRIPAGEVFYEVKGRPETLKQLQRMFEYDGWFNRFFFNDRFVKLAELLMGDTVIGKNLQWFNKPPGASLPTPPHQDGYYFMLEPNEAVTMWLALDEVDESNGCVRYVRGSHRRGLRPHERTGTLGFSQGIPDYDEEDSRREAAMIARPGDLLAHHALTIHRADRNASDGARRALGFIYYSAAAREDAERAQAYRAAVAADWMRSGKL
ncbi:MAG: phytanoyl-CoA dioxygenase family protein [Blastocatellia bacterium]